MHDVTDLKGRQIIQLLIDYLKDNNNVDYSGVVYKPFEYSYLGGHSSVIIVVDEPITSDVILNDATSVLTAEPYGETERTDLFNIAYNIRHEADEYGELYRKQFP